MAISFTKKVIIVTAALMLVLLLLTFKAIMIRQQRLDWLQTLNRELAPDSPEAQAPVSAAPASPDPLVPLFDAAEPTPASPPGTEENEIDRGISAVLFALAGFSNYAPARRAAAEEEFGAQFESLIGKAAAAERAGNSSEVLRKLETLFQKMDCLGYPFQFQATPARDRFVARISAGWPKLPYVCRWACIRMLGIVGGDGARGTLRTAMAGGVFEDEAAAALLRTGDPEALPVLIDYIARGRIKGDRYREIREAVQRSEDPRVMEGLIGLLDSADPSIRSAALLLVEEYARQSRTAPKETSPSDRQLQEKWAHWWREASGSYRPLPEDGRGIVALTLITGWDFLPKSGPFAKASFFELSKEIDACFRDLRSLDLSVHRRGELSLYRIVRLMVEHYEAGGTPVRQMLDQYLAVCTGEAQKVCLRQGFPDSAERTAFLRWVEGWMEKGKLPVTVFLVRLAGICGDKGSSAALLRYAQSWVPEVRRAAAMSLGLLGEPWAVDEIAKMLSLKDIPWDEGERMVVGLERIGNDKAIETLLLVLARAKSILAYQAYLSLRRIRREPSKEISLEEFEQRREGVAEEYERWLRSKRERKRQKQG
ncbi:MAG: hypothetical protein IT574_11760 [Candidatus Aureabacteria bacterium]|nr:hypothetical protein [Candidatus Auribacterota bacterium]NLW93622.1 hypothetical protein [Chlamydiota bacterium]HQM52914.1 hypothetical protein [bacterium]